MQPAIAFQPVRVVSAWTPAATRSRIGQAPAPAVSAPPPAFIDGPLSNLIIDLFGATSTGFLAYGAAQVKSRWAYVFGGVAAILTFKALLDGSRIRS